MDLKKVRKNLGIMGQPVIEYFLMLFVILECNSAYRCVSDRNAVVYNLQTKAIVFGLILLVLLIQKDRNNKKALFDSAVSLCGIFVFAIAFLFFNAIKTGAVANYMLVFLIFLPLMTVIFRLYRELGTPYQLFYRLADITVVLALLSFIIWFFSAVLGIMQPTGQVPLDWGGKHFADNYFNLRFSLSWQKEYLGFLNATLERNTGIFPESPMYNIFLITALYTEFFLRKRTDWIRILLLSLTILSTFGTLGIMLALAAYLLRFIYSIDNRNYSNAVIFSAIGLTLFFILLLVYNKSIVGAGSFGVHVDDYIASFKAWQTAPLFGNGYDNETVIQSFMSSFRQSNKGLSNSIAVVLAEGGCVLFVFYLIPFAILFRQYTTTENSRIAYWAVGIFGLFATTIFHYRFYMILILAFGYSFLDIGYNADNGRCIFSSHSEQPYERLGVENARYKNRCILVACLLGLSLLSCMVHIYEIVHFHEVFVGVAGIAVTLIQGIIVVELPVWREIPEKYEWNKKQCLALVCAAGSLLYFIIHVALGKSMMAMHSFFYQYGLFLENTQWRFVTFLAVVGAVLILILDIFRRGSRKAFICVWLLMVIADIVMCLNI